MLGRFVVPASRLDELGDEPRALSVVADAPVPGATRGSRRSRCRPGPIEDRRARTRGLRGAAADRTAPTRRPRRSGCAPRFAAAAPATPSVRGAGRLRPRAAASTVSRSRRPPASTTPCGGRASTASSTCSPRRSSATRRRRSPTRIAAAFALDAASFRWRDREAGAGGAGARRGERFARSAAARSSSPSRSCRRSACCRERLRRLRAGDGPAPRWAGGSATRARPRAAGLGDVFAAARR